MNKKLIGYALTIALSLSGGAAIADTYIPRAATYGYHLVTYTGAVNTENISADPSPNAFVDHIVTTDGHGTVEVGFNNGSTYLNAEYNPNYQCDGLCQIPGSVNGNTFLSYYVTVIAPNNASVFEVPIHIDGTAIASSSLDAIADATIVATDGFFSDKNAFSIVCPHGISSGSNPCGVSNFSINGTTFAYTPNDLATPLFSSRYSFIVGLNTLVEIASENRFTQGITFASSYVYIDPTFAAANPGYSLMFSAGIDNAAPVPLPASAWLLISSIGGLGVFARKRKA